MIEPFIRLDLRQLLLRALGVEFVEGRPRNRTMYHERFCASQQNRLFRQWNDKLIGGGSTESAARVPLDTPQPRVSEFNDYGAVVPVSEDEPRLVGILQQPAEIVPAEVEGDMAHQRSNPNSAGNGEPVASLQEPEPTTVEIAPPATPAERPNAGEDKRRRRELAAFTARTVRTIGGGHRAYPRPTAIGMRLGVSGI